MTPISERARGWLAHISCYFLVGCDRRRQGRRGLRAEWPEGLMNWGSLGGFIGGIISKVPARQASFHLHLTQIGLGRYLDSSGPQFFTDLTRALFLLILV